MTAAPIPPHEQARLTELRRYAILDTPPEAAFGRVVALAARGLRNQDIADQLLIGTGTVRTHLRRIFVKLDLTSRAELAARVAALGPGAPR